MTEIQKCHQNLLPQVSSKLIVDLTMYLKTESNNISVFNIILITDNPLLNQNGCDVNLRLKYYYEEKNLYLTDNTKKIKSHHSVKGKFHLNRKGLNY